MAKDISVALTLDNKQFDRGIAQSSKDVQQFGSTSTKSLAKTAGAVAALTAAFRGLQKGLNIAATFQDLRSSLSTVFGGLDECAAAFQRVTDIASRTQFQVEDITKAFIQLKGSGIDPTEKVIMTFANAAAITTDQLGSFQAAISLLSRTTAGGLGLEELERLGDRGIPVYDILNKKLGITRLQISEVGRTAAGAKKIIEALGDGINERFGNALQNRIKNTNQRLSNFNDQLSVLADSLLSGANEAFGELVGSLTKAVAKLNENTEAVINFGKAIGILIGIVVTGFAGKGIIGLFNMLNNKAGASATIIQKLGAAFKGLTGISLANNAMNAHMRITGKLEMETTKLNDAQRKSLRLFAGLGAVVQITGVIYGLIKAFQLYQDVLKQQEINIVEAIVGKGRESVEKEIEELALKVLDLTDAMN
jgi:phage tail tape-measure protein